MNLTARTKICMVIGDPVEDSMSPELHNAGYEALHIDNEFVYVGCGVTAGDLEDFIKGIRAMGIRGVSCKMPHKLAIMQYLDEIDPLAQNIGAVNTVVNNNGKLKGYNTDWIGIVRPLEAITPLNGKKVALLGAGGAARAAAYGLAKAGTQLTIYNRTLDKAEGLATELKAQSQPMSAIEELKAADIIVNATSIGSLSNKQSPVPTDLIKSGQIVFDIITVPAVTPLLQAAKQKGALTINGLEMLLYQGMEQFKLYTGHDAPESAMRQSLAAAKDSHAR